MSNEPRCARCGHPRSNHPYRHPFVGPSWDDTIKTQADRIEELEAKLAKAALAEYDDGAVISLSSFAGGASEGGEWSSLTLMKEEADGSVSFRDYKAETTGWRQPLAELKGGTDG